MELKELKCKNCGANLKVEPDKKDVTCNFCHTTFSVETAENTGYEFEKGRMKAQREEMANNLKAAKDAVSNGFNNINNSINHEEVEKTAKTVGIVFAVVAVIIFVLAGVFIFSIFIGFGHAEKASRNSFDKFDIEVFNNSFEFNSGTQPLVSVKTTLDEVVTTNKKGEHTITVIYNDTETSEPDEIIKLKQSLESKDYEVSFDYDDDGFINEMTIEDIE